MTYRQRLTSFISIDSCLILLAIFISMFLVNINTEHNLFLLLFSSFALILCHLLFSVKFNLYKKVWEYASVSELLIIFKIVTYATISILLIQLAVFQESPIRLLAVTWLLHLFFIGGSRFVWRIYRDTIMNKSDHKIRTLIVGAGSAGTMVARQLQKNNEGNLIPIAFIDDDIKKHQLDILGLPVVGNVKDIKHVVDIYNIDNIVIAIPSLCRPALNTIFKECAKTKAHTKILPLLEDIITGRISVSQFRDVQVEDLLGRDPVTMDMESIADHITNKVILVTGAGGSIGSEISRQIASFHPTRLILLGHGENSIYMIEMELRESYKHSNIEFVTEIADIQDAKKMTTIVNTYKPHVVYHSAAHKHVPLMERNPDEAVKNNMIGTMNIANAAKENNVDVFVMISTDKAVNPTSVMGASKRLAEMIIQDMNKKCKTTFVAVRFGNVLGSRGSVIPLFKKQIEQGGPVTITHPDMVRYFMTIPEASRLVIQASVLAKGGEVFVLDMGAPVKISDLAKNLIKLSGNTLEEIGIAYTGIRPGEKLFEELLTKDEVHDEQIYPKIYVGKETTIHYEEIQRIIAEYQSYDKDMLRREIIDLANGREMTIPKSLVSI